MTRDSASSGRTAPAGRYAGRRAGYVIPALFAQLLGMLLLSACAGLGGPDYQRPEAPEKAAFSQSATGVTAASAIQPDWWRAFGDPYLSDLVERAIASNVDIRILAARTGVAQAAISQAEAGLLPVLTAGAGTDTFKSSGSPSTTQYSAASDVIWELDIWGKVRKGIDAQQAEYRASEADWRAGYLVMVADVATGYFQIRQLDEQLAQQRKTLARNREILDIYTQMQGEGLMPRTAVLQQQAEINRLQTILLDLQRLRKVTENGLATLLGVPADTLQVPEAGIRSVQAVEVPAGLPSGLMSRRPDIIAAEYRVLQAHNLAGQARLARLPSVSITGRGGSASFALSDLLKSWTAGLSSLISIPVFDPNVQARIKVSDAQTRLTEEQYRRTVLGAFEEVENALTNLSNHRQQAMELSGRRDKLAVVSDQVYAQLDEGMVSQLEVFEVERSLLDAEQQALANHWQILGDTVALFKALGGGWPQETVTDASR